MDRESRKEIMKIDLLIWALLYGIFFTHFGVLTEAKRNRLTGSRDAGRDGERDRDGNLIDRAG